ncbi:hypothetical protein CPB84DRAFT_704230 [Gymnopilus junonius]|uniref:Uncharacterized protein n=1 Tax=Gymnopilus junonius TaxID=109634 RepID=A0A9P5TEZ1_GYMJU|nr:hypothetical protein CPB84DRAFT_704230 [Gymnopilus junonius]
MGVELGKVLAKNILAQLEKPEDVQGHDSSVCIPCHLCSDVDAQSSFRQRVLSTITKSTGRNNYITMSSTSKEKAILYYCTLICIECDL